LPGGPGQSGQSIAPLAAVLTGVRKNRDLVLIDPRGTGRSAPLECPALSPRDAIDALIDAMANDTAVHECLEQLQRSDNADLAQYTTASYVADIDAVRNALGYQAINLLGASYGTRVAQEYLRRYPQHVRSLVLDGVATPSMRIDLDVWPAREAALNDVLQACSADAPCHDALPDFEATLVKIRSALDGKGTVTLADPRTGASREIALSYDLVIGALQAFVYAPELSSLIPSILDRAASGDFAPLFATAMMFSEDLDRTMNFALHYAVICAEDAARVKPDEVASLGARLRAPSLAQRNLTACEGWPRPPLPEDFASSVVSDKPVLLLSGGLDPVTPPANAEIVARTLSNHRHVVAAGYGHIVSPHACAPRLIESFIDEAGFATLPQSCLDYFVASKRPPLFATILESR